MGVPDPVAAPVAGRPPRARSLRELLPARGASDRAARRLDPVHGHGLGHRRPDGSAVVHALRPGRRRSPARSGSTPAARHDRRRCLDPARRRAASAPADIAGEARTPDVVAGWSLRATTDEPPADAPAPAAGCTRARLPRTKLTSPAPLALFDGTLEVDGETITVARLAGHDRAQLGRAARRAVDLAARARVRRRTGPAPGWTSRSAGCGLGPVVDAVGGHRGAEPGRRADPPRRPRPPGGR